MSSVYPPREPQGSEAFSQPFPSYEGYAIYSCELSLLGYDPSAFSAMVSGTTKPEVTPYYWRFARREKCVDFVGQNVKTFELPRFTIIATIDVIRSNDGLNQFNHGIGALSSRRPALSGSSTPSALDRRLRLVWPRSVAEV